MAFDITPLSREEMKAFIKAHPIDHSYDKESELLDGDVPEEQLLSRDFQEILDQIKEEEQPNTGNEQP